MIYRRIGGRGGQQHKILVQ